MKLVLFIALFQIFAFASKNRCDGVRAIDESDTAAYVRVIEHLAERQALDGAALRRIADAPEPIDVMALSGLKEPEALPFRSGLADRMASGKVDWSAVREEAARLAKARGASDGHRGDVKKETASLVLPKVLVKDLAKDAGEDFPLRGELTGAVGADGALYVLPFDRELQSPQTALRHANGKTTAVELPASVKHSALVGTRVVSLTDEKVFFDELEGGERRAFPTSQKLAKFLRDNTCELSRNSCGIGIHRVGTQTIVTFKANELTQVERFDAQGDWPAPPRGEFQVHVTRDGRPIAYGYTPSGKEFFVKNLATGEELLRRRIERAEERKLQTWMGENDRGELTVATAVGYPTNIQEFDLAKGTGRKITLPDKFSIGSAGYVAGRLVVESKGATNDNFGHGVLDPGATTLRMIPGAQTYRDRLLSFSVPDGRTFLVGHYDGYSGEETYFVDIATGERSKEKPKGLGHHRVEDIVRLPDGRVVAVARDTKNHANVLMQLYGP